jgi:hypothetical protein
MHSDILIRRYSLGLDESILFSFKNNAMNINVNGNIAVMRNTILYFIFYILLSLKLPSFLVI